MHTALSLVGTLATSIGNLSADDATSDVDYATDAYGNPNEYTDEHFDEHGIYTLAISPEGETYRAYEDGATRFGPYSNGHGHVYHKVTDSDGEVRRHYMFQPHELGDALTDFDGPFIDGEGHIYYHVTDEAGHTYADYAPDEDETEGEADDD